jgi:(p)ppGpp synthase/HD superfamily hydrolase
MPGKFKDYIAIPKSNGYQSIHSTLMGPHGIPIQLHIRTHAMEEIAENGIMSHLLHQNHDSEFLSAKGRTANWINNILDIQSSSFSAHDFLESIKQDLSPGDIYVFTPKGKIISLPKGSTPIDFAYAIHSDIGNHCNIALVNQKTVKLDAKLQNGDIIEIKTKDTVEPDESWLLMATSGRAISRIKQYFKEQKFDDDVQTGLELINTALTIFDSTVRCNYDLYKARSQVEGSDEQRRVLNVESVYQEDQYTTTSNILDKLIHKHYPKSTMADMLHNVGIGKISALEVAKYILGHTKNDILPIKLSKCHLPNFNTSDTTDTVDSTVTVNTTIAPIIHIIQDPECLPLPGDTILAKLTKQKDLLLHTQTCKQNKNIGLDNLTLVHIINDRSKVFFAKIQALISNDLGTFTKFAGLIAKQKINIIELTQEAQTKESASINATLGVYNRREIDELITILSKTNFVKQITLLYKNYEKDGI